MTFVGATALFIVQTFFRGMMHRSCSSIRQSRRPRQTRVRLGADILGHHATSSEYFTENSPFALSRTVKACYNELRKRHTRRKSKLTPQAKGAITMAWKDNFGTIKSTAAVVAQSAAKKTRQLISRYKGQLGHSRRGRQIKKPTRGPGQASIAAKFYRWKSRTRPNTLPWCDKITASRKTIEALRAEIDAAKGRRG